MKRTASTIFLIMLLSSMLYSAFKIMPVGAVGTIYIRADGSIDPPTAPISTVDNFTYILTGNVTPGYTSGIVIERSNVIVDGNGFIVWGSCNNSYSGDGVTLSNVYNVTIRKMNIGNFSYGIKLFEASHNTILENNVTENDVSGVTLFFSSNNNIVSRNYFTKNGFSALDIEYSSNNTLSENSIVNSSFTGIEIYESNDNIVSGNNVTRNLDGILLFTSCSNKIIGNVVSNNHDTGIGLYYSSDNNVVASNTLADNQDRGIGIAASISNKIYLNNFLNNGNLYPISDADSMNTWDDGYASGGNYWSDLNPPDVLSGPYQNETGGDKIGDTPYFIDANNTDRYPLIYPYAYVPSPDFNDDGILDIYDLARLAGAYVSVPGSLNWDPYVDLKQNGLIDVLDLVVIAVNFGETWPPL